VSVGFAQRVNDPGGGISSTPQLRHTVVGIQRHTAICTQRTGVQGSHMEAIPIRSDLGPRQSKDLYRDPKLKYMESVMN